jgi:hypothetical protein
MRFAWNGCNFPRDFSKGNPRGMAAIFHAIFQNAIRVEWLQFSTRFFKRQFARNGCNFPRDFSKCVSRGMAAIFHAIFQKAIRVEWLQFSTRFFKMFANQKKINAPWQ